MQFHFSSSTGGSSLSAISSSPPSSQSSQSAYIPSSQPCKYDFQSSSSTQATLPYASSPFTTQIASSSPVASQNSITAHQTPIKRTESRNKWNFPFSSSQSFVSSSSAAQLRDRIASTQKTPYRKVKDPLAQTLAHKRVTPSVTPSFPSSRPIPKQSSLLAGQFGAQRAIQLKKGNEVDSFQAQQAAFEALESNRESLKGLMQAFQEGFATIRASFKDFSTENSKSAFPDPTPALQTQMAVLQELTESMKRMMQLMTQDSETQSSNATIQTNRHFSLTSSLQGIQERLNELSKAVSIQKEPPSESQASSMAEKIDSNLQLKLGSIEKSISLTVEEPLSSLTRDVHTLLQKMEAIELALEERNKEPVVVVQSLTNPPAQPPSFQNTHDYTIFHPLTPSTTMMSSDSPPQNFFPSTMKASLPSGRRSSPIFDQWISGFVEILEPHASPKKVQSPNFPSFLLQDGANTSDYQRSGPKSRKAEIKPISGIEALSKAALQAELEPILGGTTSSSWFDDLSDDSTLFGDTMPTHTTQLSKTRNSKREAAHQEHQLDVPISAQDSRSSSRRPPKVVKRSSYNHSSKKRQRKPSKLQRTTYTISNVLTRSHTKQLGIDSV